MANHYAFTALVDAVAPAKGDSRTLLVERYPYVVATANESQSLAADNGGLEINHLIYNGWLFARDDTDATTAHDGTTCLVSSDGVRFKLEDIAKPTSVLDILNPPPGSPTVGDAYLIDTAPTGAWASNAKYLTVYTARGWVFIAPLIGMQVFVEDVERYYHYSVAGSWTAGIDDGSGLAADSVYPNALLYPTGIVPVENQTTNTPPSIPAAGTAYVIGSSPTGDWAAKADYLAVSNGTSWEYHAPSDGMAVYDKALNNYYKYEGAAWAVFISGGKCINYWVHNVLHTDGTNTLVTAQSGSGGADWNAEPTNVRGDVVHTESIALQNSANSLIIHASMEGFTGMLGLALFVDTEVAPRSWHTLTESVISLLHIHDVVEIGDTSSHNYKFRAWSGSMDTPVYWRLTITILEMGTA